MDKHAPGKTEEGRFAGILRLLAEAIADKILHEQRAVVVQEAHEAASDSSCPAATQEKGKEGASVPAEDPRPPPPV